MDQQMNGLTREEILAMDDLVIEPHPVPEWKGRVVFVRSLSALERGEIEGSAAQFKESKGRDASFARTFTVTMAWMGMCDASGARLFPKREDVTQLQTKNASAISGIAEHIQRLSGFSPDDLEQMEKNSVTAQPESSPSA